ncbi:MAG TPA: ABC transporter substrate binding protein, partial [Blastocatellia bacterium]|nr:ABC transporter substrate binding protein [Blastocatellia bacterium]
ASRRLRFIPALLAGIILLLFHAAAVAQQPPSFKHVLVLDWYDKDNPWNVAFDQSFRDVLQSAADGEVEYYAEYLETNRFPGESQALLLRDYLRKKYADRAIDVLVANSDASLNFLLEHRQNLFPNTPIVFVATRRPTAEELASGPGLTGIVNIRTHKETLDLALKLHPGTEEVFVISGTLERDKRFETLARGELQGYESRVGITYLTDLEPDELSQRVKSLPKRSIVLYVWQQAHGEHGTIIESRAIFERVARSVSVPTYSMTHAYVGIGVVGGYVTTPDGIGVRAAEIALRITNGERARDIPVESAPTLPVFDWRELQRWGIGEDRLPTGSFIRFKDQSFWDQYRWQIIGVISLCMVEAFLIFALLAQRSGRGRAEEQLRLSEEKFYKAFHGSPDVLAIARRSDGVVLEVNDRYEALFGYSRAEAVGRTTLDLRLYVNPKDRRDFFRVVEEQGFVRDFETDLRNKAGEHLRVVVSAESMTINKEPCLVIIIRDITERKRAAEALRQSYDRIKDLAGRLIVAQEEERKHIARELHDDLNQEVAALAIGLGKLERKLRESNGSIRSELIKLEDRTTGLSERIRRLSHEVHSSTLEHVGLAEAVKLLCSELMEQKGIAVSLNLDGCDKALRSDVALCLYRVSQESLRNIARHSGAKSAQLTLVRNGDSVELCIMDQGAGFDLTESRGGGLGLVSMEERVRLLGGSLEVKSQPGAGAELKVRIPVEAGDE